ncbi:methylated-DNA--[protein]-cysteine S-methyltransferase [Thalassotalea marina]|uniref:Methylated-DNA--protein-cysteine methyltransferase n=1 Tax=Thalassotalea marina TaxID=1673741 RepID=A0A919EJ45_9GAMM|nr:methylated-DNA--[protein]-cysteine S-methyltransferase [Thalassotalea marina]GHF84944.1 methylated-DNA--protein-cysteine methyltransferase [Thalassotalea marina]
MYYTITSSPVGEILLLATDKGLSALIFQSGEAAMEVPKGALHAPERFSEVIRQLTQYFSKTRTEFDLPLDPQGTAFQQQVWQTLIQVKYGQTQSYKWLAQAIDNPKAVRAVGGANGKNPIALIIPCHRIIGSNGKLTGYAGGLTLKEKLLAHEQG